MNGAAKRIRTDQILMPQPVAAGMNVLVVMSLAYMLRGTNEDAPPITVRREGDRYRIIDGRHRYVAHHIAGRRRIPAVVEEGS